jgi:hypothetical protein
MIKFSVVALFSVCLAFCEAQNFPVPKGDGTNGSGKHPAAYTQDTGFPGYTIYAPKTPPSGVKLPILLWGNGMCSDQGLGFRNFLTEVASHGYFVIANGDPKGKGKSADTKMPKALDWVYTTGASKYPYIDKTRIIAAGQSCGGLQAYKTSVDKRITLTGIFDSGNLQGNSPISKLHAPVAYFLGGTSDMAYKSVSLDDLPLLFTVFTDTKSVLRELKTSQRSKSLRFS